MQDTHYDPSPRAEMWNQVFWDIHIAHDVMLPLYMSMPESMMTIADVRSIVFYNITNTKEANKDFMAATIIYYSQPIG